MQRIKTKLQEISVRRDRKRAPSRTTRDRDYFSTPPDFDRSGDWKRWEAMGTYFAERYARKELARAKVLGRRKDRRRLNRARDPMEEVSASETEC